jgi:hypothetical protein
MADRITRDFSIDIVRYAKSDLLNAFSNELPGLLVPARSLEEMDKFLPGAIKELLEAQGAQDIHVDVKVEPPDLPEEFISHRRKAHVTLSS